jgi:hypothetical protein
LNKPDSHSRQGAAPLTTPLTIVSGGQTGVDRAALDAALRHGIPCGGWCPAGRITEEGVLPARYPLRELEGSGYIERTRANVTDSDGTAIIYAGVLEGGTERTMHFCVEHGKPYLLIDGDETAPQRAAERIAQFIARHRITVLNVAGPRASKQPHIYGYALAVMDDLLGKTGSRQ